MNLAWPGSLAPSNELFDWPETGKRALARHWETRSPGEREEFSTLFADLIERSYIGKIEAYSGERIVYLGETIEGDQATVKTKLVTKSNTQKLTAIGMALVAATALITGVVVANWSGSKAATSEVDQGTIARSGKSTPVGSPAETSRPVMSPAGNRTQRANATPSAADVDACNHYGRSQTDKTIEVVKDALIGGAVGAGVGAAGGAIANGGKGAGKGAGTGGLLGASAGTLFGPNEANKQDARAADAYRACMRSRGYTG